MSEEFYRFTNGYEMKRERDWPFYWVLRSSNGTKVGRDQYRHDVIERHGLTIAEHVEAAA